MLTKSRWVFHINNPFMNQDLTAQIEPQDDGSTIFYAVTSKGLKLLPTEMADNLTIDGDTISVEIKNEQMKGMKIGISVTFGEETAEGYFKVPIFGKMKFNGERLEIDDLPIIPSEETSEEAE